jgi:hypothetical protein
MKRAILLIVLILVCVSGFLVAGGILPWTPASDSGVESVLSFLFQSQYSVVYALVFFLLLGSILYRKELARLIHAFYLRVSGPPAFEEVYTEPELSAKMKQTEQKIADTEQALGKFSNAIEKYATHLSSHTGAIQGLNAASQELQKGAAQQNRVLMRFMENVDNPTTPQKKTPHWKIDPAPLKTPKPETPAAEPPTPISQTEKTKSGMHPVIPIERKNSYPPGCARNRRKKTDETLTSKTEQFPDISPRMPDDITIEPESLDNIRKYIDDLHARSGKARTRNIIAAEALAAEEEIMNAIRNLNARLDESEFQE